MGRSNDIYLGEIFLLILLLHIIYQQIPKVTYKEHAWAIKNMIVHNLTQQRIGLASIAKM